MAGNTPGQPWRREPDSGDPDALAHHTISLPDPVSEALLAGARASRVVPFATALAAFALMIADAGPAGGARHAVTSMFASRLSRAEESVVGRLSNRVTVLTPPWTGTVEDCVRAAR